MSTTVIFEDILSINDNNIVTQYGENSEYCSNIVEYSHQIIKQYRYNIVDHIVNSANIVDNIFFIVSLFCHECVDHIMSSHGEGWCSTILYNNRLSYEM